MIHCKRDVAVWTWLVWLAVGTEACTSDLDLGVDQSGGACEGRDCACETDCDDGTKSDAGDAGEPTGAGSEPSDEAGDNEDETEEPDEVDDAEEAEADEDDVEE